MKRLLFLLLTAFCFFLPFSLFAQMEWIRATNSATWFPRAGHTSVVFDNKMWVLGGYDFSNLYNDVWFSTDGVNWTCATASADWSARAFHTSVVFDNKIWMFGGESNNGFKHDVWYSRGLGIGEERTTLDAERFMPEIYPNPAKSYLAIRFSPTANRRTIKIFDVSGKLVKALEVTSAQEHKQEIRISLKGINPGIYFLQLGTENKKFLVAK
jgi:hypothetical protein